MSSFATRPSALKTGKRKTAWVVKRLSSPHAFVLTGTPLENRILEDQLPDRILNNYFGEMEPEQRLRYGEYSAGVAKLLALACP